jgi:hypothetical protein
VRGAGRQPGRGPRPALGKPASAPFRGPARSAVPACCRCTHPAFQLTGPYTVCAARRLRLEGLDLDALRFSTLLVDPPRAGLDPATLQLLREFDRVVYISCNPGTRGGRAGAGRAGRGPSSCKLFPGWACRMRPVPVSAAHAMSEGRHPAVGVHPHPCLPAPTTPAWLPAACRHAACQPDGSEGPV